MAARSHSHGGAGESSSQAPDSPHLEHHSTSPMSAIPEDIEQDEGDFPEPICGGCRRIIDEDSADAGVIHFATQLWHVDCFRCAKCQNHVSTDRDDILLLSDGHPICGQCNYNCSICRLPIMEEAIMTGDESYHASCFTCRSCHSPIDDLVFAKTSQGIYCMPCHNERVARSRRHAENKKRLAAAKAAAAKEAAEQAAREAVESRAESHADSTLTGSSIGYYSIPEPPPRPNGQLSNVPSPITSTLDITKGSASPTKTPSSAPIHSSAWINKEQPQPSPPLQRPGSAGDPSVGSRRANNGPSGPSLRELRMGAGTLADRFTRPPVADAPVSLNVGISSSESTPVIRQGFEGAREGEVGSGMVRSASEETTSDSRQTRGSKRSGRPSNSREGRPSNSRDGPPLSKPQSPLIGLGIEDKQTSTPSRDLALPNVRNGRSASVSSADASGSDALTPSTSYRDLEAVSTDSAQLKRASRMSIRPSSKGSSGTAKADDHKSRAFSFYDPDFIDLMDSFGRIGTDDDDQVSSPVPPLPKSPAVANLTRSKRSEEPASPPEMQMAPPEVRIWDDADEDASPMGSPTESTDATTEESAPMPSGMKGRPISLHRAFDDADEADAAALEDANEDENDSEAHGAGGDDTKVDTRREGLKIDTISEKMRESIETARDGHVSMDTTFVESVLRELEATKEKMKLLQSKHDHLRRASRHAAMGFSSAKAEYEQELEARFEAETEMLRLKRQLADQAAQLASMSSQREKEAEAERRSQEVKDSLQGMERDLAKLTVERDLTVAEVAGLVAIQKGREPIDGPTSTSLQRSLTQRMEGVKEKYRREIGELTEERDVLLIEIEELKQSREIFMGEAESLNVRNEELNKRNAQLTKRLEQAEGMMRQAQTNARHGFGTMSPNSASGSGSRRGYGGMANGSSSSVAGGGGGHHSLSSSIDSGRMVAPSKDYADSLSSYEAAPPPRSAPIVTRAEAPPKKFKWMKPKLSETVRSAAHNLPLGQSPPVPPKMGSSSPGHNNGLSAGQFGHQHQASGDSFSQASNGISSAGSNHGHGHVNGGSSNNGHAGDVVVREHLFQPHNALRPVRCLACQKNMWGQSEHRCAVCGQSCHSKCLQTLATSCQQPYSRAGEESSEPTGPSMFGRSLSEQAAAEGREVPYVVERCIQAVEKLGMDYEGIYRKSGGTSQLRIITQLFERGQAFNLEDTERFNDVSAITSVLKNYFRELPEPLLTFELHEGFIEAAEMKSNPLKREALMDKLIRSLPRANFATLRYLIRHLHRVEQGSSENRMNARNLGVVFGPTLMRSADPSQEFAHMGGKAMTIEYMIENAHLFEL